MTRIHESERRLRCSYCRRQFKNRGETKRHEIQIHVCPEAWSYPPFAKHPAMFHESESQLGETDACDCCGDEFPSSRFHDQPQISQGGIVERVVTDRDWNKRIRCLVETHKFGMCAAGKMYYRADHFYQHLRLHKMTNGSRRRLCASGHQNSVAS